LNISQWPFIYNNSLEILLRLEYNTSISALQTSARFALAGIEAAKACPLQMPGAGSIN
jgi:hypothetical protein